MSLFSARNLLFAGAGLYVATAFGTYCIVSRSGPTSCGGHAHGFDGLAETYDQLVSMDELFMGMNWLRWGLLGEAKGDVLEISAGTGRSLPHYRLPRLRSLTFSDTSSNMLLKAREKVRQRAAWDRDMPTIRFALADAENLAVDATKSEKPPQPVKAQAKRVTSQPSGEQDVDAELLRRAAAAAAGAAATAVPKSFTPRSFDTVVDAFGLCSHDDPVQALRQASLMCKEDGVILLLEHGRSTWSLLNQQLDRSAQQHYDTWSCWWNRDILDIVKQAGLHVVSCSRWHFGTTYCIVAKPVPAPQPGTSSGS